MAILGIPVLSLMIFLPVAGMLVLVFIPRRREGWIKNFSLFVTLLVFGVSLAVLFRFDGSLDVMQMVEKRSWLPGYGIQYFLGIDGISLWLVLLTTFLMPISVLASYSGITKSLKEYMIFMLLLETGMVGVFLALDLFLFYIFWELMLIPMYFLIGVWGGERRIYAAIKFFLYTMAGSVLMLVAILALYFYNKSVTGEFTFDLLELYRLNLPVKTQLYMFSAFFLAFAFKVPMFPFHTWLPDAHVEAPTAGSVILAGVLLKMGTYGFLRFAIPLFPQATIDMGPVVSVLAIIGIIYGALVAMVQKDVKKLVAYSSVSHLGFVMLGIFALNIQGLEGGIIQMINHGLSTGALFLIVGIIYERRHTRLIENFGGLSKVVPLFAAFFMVVTLSSIGLPGLNGFVGEFLILLGTFKANKAFAVLGATGVILAAIYMLWMFQRVMFGGVTIEENRKIPDMNLREIAYMLPIIVFIVWIGVYPQPFLRKMDASVKNLIQHVESRVQVSESDQPYHERIMARYFDSEKEAR
jgi:NADH-quinone oxidoreductase subunit M